MIKVSHIMPLDEKKVCNIIARALRKEYKYYFEVKSYEGYVNTSAQYIIKARKSLIKSKVR